MSVGRRQTGNALRDAGSADPDEAPMTSSGHTDGRRYVDRRLRNRLILANLLAWIAIFGLICWLWP